MKKGKKGKWDITKALDAFAEVGVARGRYSNSMGVAYATPCSDGRSVFADYQAGGGATEDKTTAIKLEKTGPDAITGKVLWSSKGIGGTSGSSIVVGNNGAFPRKCRAVRPTWRADVVARRGLSSGFQQATHVG